jgi:hypothetical protein
MKRGSRLVRILSIVCVVCLALGLPGTRNPAAAQVLPAPDPVIAGLLDQVQTDELVALVGTLSGEWPALVEHTQYPISTRATTSGIPLQKATQFVYEYLQARGLAPGFHEWEYRGYTGRNVIGSLPGITKPDEIILLTAHLDDNPWTGRAPGADDNASGCTALLEAADILSEYRFGRTLRFAFFTGEEQGMLGSHEYAAWARTQGQNIAAVLNLDMIAYDSLGNPDVKLHIQTETSPLYSAELAIAQTFASVVGTYGLDLTPIITPYSHGSSDHASFWAQNYPAMLVIEDDEDDFNIHYHSPNDRLAYFNLAYFTDFVKAAIGTGAVLAGPEPGSPGDYRAQLDQPAVLLRGLTGAQATYALTLTNMGSLTDTYTLAVMDGTWTTSLPSQVGPLAPGASASFSVTVNVPQGTLPGAADTATLSVVSQGSGQDVDWALLTTLASWRSHYLPLIMP